MSNSAHARRTTDGASGTSFSSTLLLARFTPSRTPPRVPALLRGKQASFQSTARRRLYSTEGWLASRRSVCLRGSFCSPAVSATFIVSPRSRASARPGAWLLYLSPLSSCGTCGGRRLIKHCTFPRPARVEGKRFRNPRLQGSTSLALLPFTTQRAPAQLEPSSVLVEVRSLSSAFRNLAVPAEADRAVQRPLTSTCLLARALCSLQE